MGTALADLDARDIARLRVELCEVIATRFAVPPFFDYRLGRARVRPLASTGRKEIAAFVQSASLDPVIHADVASGVVRKFLQSLFLRYLEESPELTRGLLPRRHVALRADTWHAAGEVQRGLVDLASGRPGDFGVVRPPTSWLPKKDGDGRPEADWKRIERETQALSAVLVHSGENSPRDRGARTGPTPGRAAGGTGDWAGAPLDHTAPLHVVRPAAAPAESPFAGLAIGSQSSLFGEHAQAGMSDQPTTQQPIVGLGSLPPVAAPRELPSDLYKLYAGYMRDLNLSESKEVQSVKVRGLSAPSVPGPAAGWADPTASPHYPRQPSDPRSDVLIFDQLRHQVDAYIRLAARSYGVRVNGSDPASALDALRRSGNVEGADLRLAEGILAIADRVCATGTASIDDYRQAFMFYLLYHRARVGA
jgi:hypothetical protein